MATSKAILYPSINASTQKNFTTVASGAPIQQFGQLALYEQNDFPKALHHDIYSERHQLLTRNIDPILLLRQHDSDNSTTDCSVLNHFPFLAVLPVAHDHFSRQDSRRGINDLADAGMTGSKIRAGAGPLMNLVHVLRDSWNVRNLESTTPHHINHNSNHEEGKMASTMTLRPLPTEYSPSHRMKTTHEPRGNYSLSRNNRIRSRSIAIKRPTIEHRMEEIRQNSLAAEYDWATWRMYNRIIEHRQKNPLPYSHEDTVDSSESISSAANIEESQDSLLVNNDENQSMQQGHQQYYPEYGEVFDLDL